ncbi:hypothetical protein HDV05_001485, partial [Chytridiales sp. JEL 0842]
LDLVLALLRIDSIDGMSGAEVRQLVQSKMTIDVANIKGWLSKRHYHLEFLCDECSVDHSDIFKSFVDAIEFGFLDFAKRLKALPIFSSLVSEARVWQRFTGYDVSVVERMMEVGFDVESNSFFLERLSGMPWTFDTSLTDDHWVSLDKRLSYALVDKFLRVHMHTTSDFKIVSPPAFKTIEFLLQKGSKASPLALAHASAMGHKDLVQLFLDLGVVIGSEAIHAAAFAGNLQIMEHLISKAAEQQSRKARLSKLKLPPVSNQFAIPFIPNTSLSAYLTLMKRLIGYGLYTKDHFWSGVVDSAMYFNTSFSDLKRLITAGGQVSSASLSQSVGTMDIATFRLLKSRLRQDLHRDSLSKLLTIAGKNRNMEVAAHLLELESVFVSKLAMTGLAFLWVPVSVGPPKSDAYEKAAKLNVEILEKALGRLSSHVCLCHECRHDYVWACLQMYFEEQGSTDKFHQDMDLLVKLVSLLLQKGFCFPASIRAEMKAHGWGDVLRVCAIDSVVYADVESDISDD